jgi:demethylmenaquinone methyltransferase/2-methoxy-6-polyprenyl-1,4-benzoquinol methylase
MSGDARLIEYYAKRAHEYERIYAKPERQADLAAVRRLCDQSFAGHRVLEIACGTGYWTQVISHAAKSIVATDINDEVLQIARTKNYGCHVSFQKADAFAVNGFPQTGFTAGLAAAWWSHLRKSQIERFLLRWHQLFPPGALMVFMDNRFVAGSNTPISRTDDEGNTYQRRQLADGSEHEVLKNFPSEKEIRASLGNSAQEIRWLELPYFWFLTYQLK